MKLQEFSMLRACRLRSALAAAVPWLIAVQTSFALTPTITTLTSTTPVSNLGAAVTLTAKVTDNMSNPVTTGAVAFFDGVTPLGAGALDNNGQASYRTSMLASGQRTLTARYLGLGNFVSSLSAPLAQTVNAIPFGGFALASGTSTHGWYLLAVADFNSDGIPDLAVTQANTNQIVSILLGDGHGNFSLAGSSAPLGDGLGSVGLAVTADFNNDGLTDLAAVFTNAQGATVIAMLIGDGHGGLTLASTAATGYGPLSVTTADFNDDGNVDVSVVAKEGVFVLLGDGGGHLFSQNVPVMAIPTSATAADFNNDGNADLLLSGPETGYTLLLGNGNGGFNVGPKPTESASIRAVADFDGDGNQDLAAVFDYPNSLFPSVGIDLDLGDGHGNFSLAATDQFPFIGNVFPVLDVKGVVAADLNGDGKPDLAITSAGGGSGDLTVALNNVGPNPLFGVILPQAYSMSSLGGVPGPIAVADFNGDGIADFAVGVTTNTGSSNVAILLGFPKGDFNHDGHPDIVWQDPVSGTSQVWYMGGPQGATVTGAATLSGPTPWRIGAVGDFNQDGHPDLLWQNPNTGDGQLWLLGGAGGTETIGIVTEPALGGTFGDPTYRVVAAVDLEGNGLTDAAFQNTTTGFTSVRLLTQANPPDFGGSGAELLGSPWHLVGFGDFNADGIPDPVWQDPVTGAVQIWFCQGSDRSKATSAAEVTASNAWAVVAVADLNGDGWSDLVWQDPVTGASQVWFMGGPQGAIILGTATLSGPNPWRIVGPR